MKTKLATCLLSIALLVSLSDSISAQQAPRLTVQLPTFSFFRTTGTVNVPDRGQALLGSIKQSSRGSVSRGVPLLSNLPYAGRLFGNRAIGASSSASTASARVQIYDLHEMDQALLRAARQDRVLNLGGESAWKDQQRKQANRAKADFISRNIGRNRSR